MLRAFSTGADLGSRLVRSSGWIFFGYSASQFIRLTSNLILTRLLFPEAFGLMALITVFMVGLTMISDIGVAPSIQHSDRGDDPDFLNTAWTIQILRGAVLWMICCLLGYFAAWFYDEPQLLTMLPVAGLSLILAGFNPTRIETASRHLIMGRLTILDMISQILAMGGFLVLAYAMSSVWALVLGGVISAGIRLVIMQLYLPGPKNTFCWDVQAIKELINFGKWILLSTFCGFLLTQGDKAILGKYLTLDLLGIYNIGYFIAGFPQALASMIMAKVMIPLHRECPPHENRKNFSRVRKSRFIVTFIVFVMQFTLAFSGVWIVQFLYDDRFVLAGSVVVGIACMGIPYLIGMTYEYAALTRGDSRGVFNLLLMKAIIQTSFFILGMEYYGLSGALVGIWTSQVFIHPLVIRLAIRHGAWDPYHDACFGVLGALFTALAISLHWSDVLLLSSFSVQ